jgi:fructose-bisphosphate aldolase class 1
MKETLEEAAERLYPTDYGVKSKDIINIIKQDTFINGANWQQEQIGKSEFLQKLRATKSDAEARRLIKTI